MNGKAKKLTIGSIAGAIVLTGLVATTLLDFNPFIWSWDAKAEHMQLAQQASVNRIDVAKMKLDQAIGERIQVDAAVRQCDSEVGSDCSKVRGDQSWALIKENELRAEWTRLIDKKK